MPLITINHGRTDSTDGRVFPYVFPLLLNPYSETSGIVNYIASKEGGVEKLKGKKIVILYHGSPYGKETIPIYDSRQEVRLRGRSRSRCRIPATSSSRSG